MDLYRGSQQGCTVSFPSAWGGGPMSQIEGPGAWNSRCISPTTYPAGGREGQEGTFPLAGVHRRSFLTHSLTHSLLLPMVLLLLLTILHDLRM